MILVTRGFLTVLLMPPHLPSSYFFSLSPLLYHRFQIKYASKTMFLTYSGLDTLKRLSIAETADHLLP